MKEKINNKHDDIDQAACCGCAQTNQNHGTDSKRRNLLKYLALAIPAVNCFTGNTALAAIKKKSPESKLPPQVGDRFTYFSKRLQGPLIKISDLAESDKQLLVVPVDPKTGEVRDGSRYNQILIQKLSKESLSTETQQMSADGIVAYSAICTHAGCPVTGWVEEEENYMCPCHQSVFNPKEGGGVVSGPAPRKLPALALAAENDELVVAAEFNSWIGFGKPPR
ncbi:Rieske 2Fe-2S domain-containing protein [Aliiglaciecola sp. 2_MG-2023]|uniref:QcrA and Rieske domain-containing protein n=1 Tax=unclassified Aliiglaciecola TaxID=2593648 RepID=UPI0026E45468|nr:MULTISPECIES: Rieske 2Fe-2S domain-containing protein [unclassified Aliiglaciecola]MDO6711201.1 Rieske 2Fe-2S domain-containing protein [Aliiglaciecola sp. 2_MG-2023]MDO6752115.1 Rieske 2Fe-2S domain-containing protein [Aliiglaciecola sp. 1_MG-2023]